jgi:hypothetical protein
MQVESDTRRPYWCKCTASFIVGDSILLGYAVSTRKALILAGLAHDGDNGHAGR